MATCPSLRRWQCAEQEAPRSCEGFRCAVGPRGSKAWRRAHLLPHSCRQALKEAPAQSGAEAAPGRWMAAALCEHSTTALLAHAHLKVARGRIQACLLQLQTECRLDGLCLPLCRGQCAMRPCRRPSTVAAKVSLPAACVGVGSSACGAGRLRFVCPKKMDQLLRRQRHLPRCEMWPASGARRARRRLRPHERSLLMAQAKKSTVLANVWNTVQLYRARPRIYVHATKK